MKTTMYLHKKTMRILEKLSRKYDVSRTKVIIFALGKYFNDLKIAKYGFRATEYQESRNKEEWSTFHVTIDDNIYEQLGDVKNVVKKSFSLIVSLAVEELDKEKEQKNACLIINTDSYRLKAYTAVIKDNQKIQGFEFYWGIPNEETLTRLQL